MRRDPFELPPPACHGVLCSPPVVRVVKAGAIDAFLIEAWRDLGERALEPNAYLTPMFVMPTLAAAAADNPVSLVLVEHADGMLIGLGIFTSVQLLPLCKLHSLRAYRSRHSYLTGLLIDRTHAAMAVDALFDFASRPGSAWHGIRFDWLCADNALGRLILETAGRRNIPWLESERMRRAVALPDGGDLAALLRRIPPGTMKDLRRRQRRLAESGRGDWRIHCGKDVTDEVVERFLALEHMGWKGDRGSSLRADPRQEELFKAIIAGFRSEDGVFFVELMFNDEVIASSCNLLYCQRAFAFKIGWNPEYARFSPGMLNELCLLERAGEVLGHLEFLESGAAEGAYIDKLWRDRQELVSGVFATTPMGRLIFTLAGWRRRFRQAWQELSQHPGTLLGGRGPSGAIWVRRQRAGEGRV